MYSTTPDLDKLQKATELEFSCFNEIPQISALAEICIDGQIGQLRSGLWPRPEFRGYPVATTMSVVATALRRRRSATE
jgi:hypothetical protein